MEHRTLLKRPRAGLLLLGLIVAVGMFTLWITAPSQASPVTGGPALPQSVVLSPGDSAQFPDGTAIKFIEVVEDSRCPGDAMCIWQGRAVVLFDYDGTEYQLTLGAENTIPGYVVTIEDVQPYPFASLPAPAAEDYKVTITVTPAK